MDCIATRLRERKGFDGRPQARFRGRCLPPFVGLCLAGLLASCANGAGEGSTGASSELGLGGSPLLGGDAEWPRPPFAQPGVGLAQGDGGGVADSVGSGGAGSAGNTGANATGGWPGGTAGGTGTTGDAGTGNWDGGVTGESGSESADVGADETSGTGGGDTCVAVGDAASCDQVSGVCEAAIDPVTAIVGSCCDDPDCGCDGGSCTAGACQSDGHCDCRCAGTDPDCAADACEDELDERSARLPAMCPDTQDPVVLYLSNDDSNSQASPAYARAMIADGQIVPGERIRIYEFLNYYDIDHPAPMTTAAQVGLQMRRTDAGTGEFTLLMAAQSREVAPEARPPYNLAFSVDTSGSMGGRAIELVRASLRAMARQLRAGDRVSMVQWSTVQSQSLAGHPVSGPDDPALLAAIDRLDSGGGTDLHAGLVNAYELANRHYLPNGINRVVLLSDGGANAGITDIDLIAAQSDDSERDGVYLVGVGMATSARSYHDALMDSVTDAGKGAYIYIDSQAEAERMFADPRRFLRNFGVAARDVQLELTLPWYFGVKEFHGEQISQDPAEVEPQHLGPDDAMNVHQIISACDPGLPRTDDELRAQLRYRDPISGVQSEDSFIIGLEQLVAAPATQLHEADVVVNYAKAFAVIASQVRAGQRGAARQTASDMVVWLTQASQSLRDPDIDDMLHWMARYRDIL